MCGCAWLDRLHVGQWGTFVTTPRVADEAALVRVETAVVNGAAGRRDYACNPNVIAADGRVVASRTTAGQLDAGQSQALVQELDVAKPQRWSLETPVLYTLAQSRDRRGHDGRRDDNPVRHPHAGVRSGQGLSPERPVRETEGRVIHHDAGSLGAAVPDKVLERRAARAARPRRQRIRTATTRPRRAARTSATASACS